MERRDSNGAATSSGILGACAGEQRARQNARRGLSALRPIDGEEVSARYRNQFSTGSETSFRDGYAKGYREGRKE